MSNFVCFLCKTEFKERDKTKTEICPGCGRKIKPEIKIFEFCKQMSFAFAFMAAIFFAPLFLAQEQSPGYFVMPGGKGRPVVWSGNAIFILKILTSIAVMFFLGLGLWFRKKHLEKEILPPDPTVN